MPTSVSSNVELSDDLVMPSRRVSGTYALFSHICSIRSFHTSGPRANRAKRLCVEPTFNNSIGVRQSVMNRSKTSSSGRRSKGELLSIAQGSFASFRNDKNRNIAVCLIFGSFLASPFGTPSMLLSLALGTNPR